ncbi:hypothetical protein FRC20_005382 [Serendipita sp. 405]|nr:hypothetical protein FRC20_005382 [Serendipita sp. 405]
MIQSPESNLVNERQVRWQSHTAKANKFDFNTYRHPRNPSRRLISEDYLATLKVGPKRIVLSVVLEALHSRTFMSLELPGLTLPHRFYSVFWADSAPKTELLSHTGVSDIIAAHVILVLETEAEGVIYYRNYLVVLDRQGIVDMADRCLHSGQKSVLWNDWKRLARWFPYEGDGGRDCLPIFHSRMIMLARPKSIETLTNRPTGLRGSLHLVMIDFGKASPGGDAENSAFVGEIAPSLTNGDFKGDRWTGLSFRISWSNKAFNRDILRSERLHMNDNMLVVKEVSRYFTCSCTVLKCSLAAQ